jgi:hypothetical protein
MGWTSCPMGYLSAMLVCLFFCFIFIHEDKNFFLDLDERERERESFCRICPYWQTVDFPRFPVSHSLSNCRFCMNGKPKRECCNIFLPEQFTMCQHSTARRKQMDLNCFQAKRAHRSGLLSSLRRSL